MSDAISLCMICRDEEKTLYRCLFHAADLVDDIVVVDTGSTDRSVEHAHLFTDRVFHLPWRDDFSEARNFSIAQARCDWLLFLDADEVIYPAELAALRALLAGGDLAGVVLDRHEFEVNYTNLAHDDDIPWPAIEAEVQPKLRLVRRQPGLRFAGRVHESLDSRTRVGRDLRPGIRFAHYRDRTRNQRKADYYMALEEEALVIEPRNSNAHYNALQTYVLRGWREQFRAGIEHLSYVEPRYLAQFEDLRDRLAALGWEIEAERVAALVAGHRAPEGR